ncbi:MAG: hypothetical protein IJ079_07990 [Lachnospiraceae bacterium]|nr:hypothetical protein [Lachnospiraceae bacterium]
MPAFLDTPEIQVTDEDIASNRVYGILSYIGILWLVGLFAAKDSKYAKFHVNQGIVLSIFAVGFDVALTILTAILGRIAVFRVLLSLTGSVGNLAVVGLVVFGIIFAAKGRAKELPLIGRFHWFDKNND